ncbi:MAG: hypothetical protein JXN64_06125 [Spirochaetes bacterium]|nr:hypothetical protein [Spirochaetota bacterium]
MDILKELEKLIKKLYEKNIEYALCGGLAMAVYALPRATLDIDVLIEPDSLEKAIAAASEIGFNINAVPMELHNGKIIIYRITKIEAETSEHLILDILLVTPEISKVWKDRLKIEWEGGILTVISPEGLITLKSLRNSGQDQDDIQYLRSIMDED